jgi:hypothetical protein
VAGWPPNARRSASCSASQGRRAPLERVPRAVEQRAPVARDEEDARRLGRAPHAAQGEQQRIRGPNAPAEPLEPPHLPGWTSAAPAAAVTSDAARELVSSARRTRA